MNKQVFKNKQCPYCGVELKKGENGSFSRSMEHMVPEAMLSEKRGKKSGDFWACRNCNGLKSEMDDWFAQLARIQSPNSKVSLVESKKMSKRRGDRIDLMKSSMKPHSVFKDKVSVTMPLRGSEIVAYSTFLGQGAYFQERNEIFDSNKHVFVIQFHTKFVLDTFAEQYKLEHGSNPYRDIEENEKTSFWVPDECSFHSDAGKYCFFFHDSFAITITCLPKSRNNYRKSRESVKTILSDYRNPLLRKKKK